MKLHSVGWFCVICRQAVITLSGLYCTAHSEMKREERGVKAESGWSQRANGARVREILCSRSIFTITRSGTVSCVCVPEVDLVSSLLKYGISHENSNKQRAQINMNKLKVRKWNMFQLNYMGLHTLFAPLRHKALDSYWWIINLVYFDTKIFWSLSGKWF